MFNNVAVKSTAAVSVKATAQTHRQAKVVALISPSAPRSGFQTRAPAGRSSFGGVARTQRSSSVATQAFGREGFVVGLVGTFIGYLALNRDEIARKQKIAVEKVEKEQAEGIAKAKASQQAGAAEAQRKIEEGRKAAEEAAKRAQGR